MPARPIRDRLLPHKFLDILLYAPEENIDWMTILASGEVRIETGPASRHLKMRVAQLWEAIWWLLEHRFVDDVRKEQKRGSVVITLRQPPNIRRETYAS